MNIFANKTIQIIVFILLIFVILYFLMPTKQQSKNEEGFNSYDSYSIEYDQVDPVIVPENILPNGSIITGYNYVPQQEVIPAWGEDRIDEVDNFYNNDLADGEGGNYSLSTNLCSPSCCSPTYPVPFKLEQDPLIDANKEEYVYNDMYCNNSWQDAGCLCLTKKQADFIRNRGGNA